MAKKPWKEMTPAQKRVAIAKDVLLCLNLKKFKPTSGVYFSEVNGLVKPEFGCDIKRGHKCEACAKGGMILAMMRVSKQVVKATVSKDDRGRFAREIDNLQITQSLGPLFGQSIHQIEQCFEGWHYHYSGSCSSKLPFSQVIAFHFRKPPTPYESDYGTTQYWDDGTPHAPRRRLQGIMGNIIANGGDFKPETGPIFPKKRKPAKA